MKYDEFETQLESCELQNEIESKPQNISNPGLGVRHLQSLLLALCVLCGYIQRVNLSVTIVAMTDSGKHEGINESPFPVYEWNSYIQNYLHSAFFIGYLFMNFPAAIMGVHFNNKSLLLVSCAFNGALSCLTPFLITLNYTGTNNILRAIKEYAGVGNWRAFVVLRAIQGILQAFIFPTIHAISARWAPPNERSRLAGFIFNGVPFGTMVSLAGSGILASSPYLGWPSVFYVSGALGIIWVIFWYWYGASSPYLHPNISKEEYDYICNFLPDDNHKSKSKKKVPWKEILCSPPVWAIIIAHTTHSWGFWLLITEMPTFLHHVSGFNISSDGLISALPYLSMWCLQILVLWTADKLNKKGITSITAARKLWSSIGLWGGALNLIILGYFNYNAKMVLAFYIFSVSIGCCGNAGFHINHLDLSPNFAGILMGLSNALSATGGFGFPIIVAHIVQDVNSEYQWRLVFYVGAIILFLGNVFYITFGTGKIQSWNDKNSKNSDTT